MSDAIRRSVNQILGKDGLPYPASATSNLWVGDGEVFSFPTEGNKIEPFTTGKDYFADLIQACDAARHELHIAGWQVNWDALLAPGLRLYDVLLRAAERGVNIYIMPWDDTNPIQTYDDQTMAVFESINKRLNRQCIHLHLSASQANPNPRYFSHHQKQVIVDRKVAYVGGIDLAYGRYDDAHYDLRADAGQRQVLNRYNPCIPALQALANANLVNPDDLTGAVDNVDMPGVGGPSNAQRAADAAHGGSWQVPYRPNDGEIDLAANHRRLDDNETDLHTLDPSRQPRMPWQDVHCRIEGPAVSDLLRNFVLRWNGNARNRLLPSEAPASHGRPGLAHIQVLRSAPLDQRKAEYKALPNKQGAKPPAATQQDIHTAMLLLIEKSRRFIYIESQFFVSDFGQEARTADGDANRLSPAARFINTYNGGDQNAGARTVAFLDNQRLTREGFKPKIEPDWDELLNPPRNRVCAALIERITRAILDIKRPKFHVYITLPVHPEGLLSTANIAVQVYWTMQTLAFGSQSLLNGIKRALKARELRDQGDQDYERVFRDANTEHESIPTEACFEYVTLLNLRNWAKLGDRYITEQIYVHSKLMIVDDLYALLGSANINDRSLLGDRDSELAVLVMDGNTARADTFGPGSQQPVRHFAHDLRKKIWRKLFGLTAGVRPATELEQAIEQPGIPDSWRAIQRVANANAALYEAAFAWVPRNWVLNEKKSKIPASILPTWSHGKGALRSPMPFEDKFWDTPCHKPAAANLTQVKGYITALPVEWTKGENNRFDYPTSLVVENKAPQDEGQGQRQEVAARETETGTGRGVAG